MSIKQREVAKRVFAKELRDSNLYYKEHEDPYAPQYIITPTGAKCNRVFVVGTLTEKENIGAESEYWRGRISDPTGVFTIYAGQYQPQAATKLSGIEPPVFVAVVGKLNIFYPPEGDPKVSIRPEAINVVDATVRNRWVLETAQKTFDRIQKLDSDDQEVKQARDHYNADKSEYMEIVIHALKSLATEA
jgi:RPA family protein